MLTLTAIDLGAVAINSLLGMKLEALSTFDKYISDERIVYLCTTSVDYLRIDSICNFQLDSTGDNKMFHIFIDYNLNYPKLHKFLQG